MMGAGEIPDLRGNAPQNDVVDHVKPEKRLQDPAKRPEILFECQSMPSIRLGTILLP